MSVLINCTFSYPVIPPYTNYNLRIMKRRSIFDVYCSNPRDLVQSIPFRQETSSPYGITVLGALVPDGMLEPRDTWRSIGLTEPY